ncbi:MAG TPA: lasso RiPP family leader peptide-containing protein [Acidimicrobiales bacterium]|nr:lasso RiPP family leader peptide-containing protein [Acidimicrobiales bacterium]
MYYSTPKITRLGSVHELTKSSGVSTDKNGGSGDFIVVTVGSSTESISIPGGSPISVSIVGGS